MEPQKSTEQRWYVVNSLPRKEQIARVNIQNQGFRTFMPQIRRTTSHARRRTTVLRALFPGYMFVPLDLKRDQWRSINGSFGVASMIMAGDKPRAVPEGVVEQLCEISDQTGLIEKFPHLEIGQDVRILTGAFADQIGVLTSLSEANRVRVLFEILGGERMVTLNRATIVPASKHE